jgi:hypothetical protein
MVYTQKCTFLDNSAIFTYENIFFLLKEARALSNKGGKND